MRSKAFEEFNRVYFQEERSYLNWPDPPTHLALQLEGEELEVAESLLLSALEQKDSWAVVTLGEMRSKKAAEPLKRLFAIKPSGLYGSQVDVALALWRIEQFPPAIDEFFRVLHAQPTGHEDEIMDGDARLEDGCIISESDRIDAVWALREVRTAESVQAVIKALDDSSNLVRSNAVDSLADMCGPYPLIQQHSVAMMSEDLAKREQTKRTILSLIKSNEVPPTLPEGYSIGYAMPDVFDYIIYRESGKLFCFHVTHTAQGVVIPFGNYLTGMLGKPVSFSPNEKERIQPRLCKFFKDQQMNAKCISDMHKPEPKEWSQGSVDVMLPGDAETFFEFRLLNITVLRMKMSRLPICGAALAGSAGFVIGKFIHLLCDAPKWSVWLAAVLFALLGFWLGRKLQEE